MSAISDSPASIKDRASAAAIAATVQDSYGVNTRAYDFSQGTRTAVGAASSAPQLLGNRGRSGEYLLVSSTRCFIRFGGAGVLAALGTDASVLPVPADLFFHLRLPVGVTHFTVIRDTADGVFRTYPVV
jgi:hypothetical protein